MPADAPTIESPPWAGDLQPHELGHPWPDSPNPETGWYDCPECLWSQPVPVRDRFCPDMVAKAIKQREDRLWEFGHAIHALVCIGSEPYMTNEKFVIRIRGLLDTPTNTPTSAALKSLGITFNNENT